MSDKKAHSVQSSDAICQERLSNAGRAVADLAHLAKNIIQVMSGCGEIIDLAIQKGQFDRVQKAWQLYQPSFWRLKKLQLDLIKYTKKYPLDVQSCAVNDVAATAAAGLKEILNKRSIAIETRLAEGLPVLSADGQKLREAITNLLICAADNIQDETGTIALQTALENNGGSIIITVCDSGKLLDPDTQTALLTPFERCRTMLGVGLEVPLAKQVAEDHGGQLHIGCAGGQNELRLVLPIQP